MTETRRNGTMLLIISAVGILFAQAVLADVLVTKSGSRWEGKVVEEGEAYVLIKPNGSKMTFPKSIVHEVIRSEVFHTQYKAMLKSADLTDDSQVDKLAKFAAKYGLSEEREKLLKKGYDLRLRRATAKNKPDSFRAIAKWCHKYDMKTEAAACEHVANRLAFPGKLTAAGKNAMALAELAKWCQKVGLKDEAAQAEAAAIKVAPEDKKIRRLLSYVKDPATGKWVKHITAATIDSYLRHVLRKGNIGNTSIPTSVENIVAMAGDVAERKKAWYDFTENPKKPVEFLLSDLRQRTVLPEYLDIELKDVGETQPKVVRQLGKPEKSQAGTFTVIMPGGYSQSVKVTWLSYGYLDVALAHSRASNRFVQGIRLYCKPFLQAHSLPSDAHSAPGGKIAVVRKAYKSPIALGPGTISMITRDTKINIGTHSYLWVFVNVPKEQNKALVMAAKLVDQKGRQMGSRFAYGDATKFKPLRKVSGYITNPIIKELKDQAAVQRLKAFVKGKQAFKSKSEILLIFVLEAELVAMEHLWLIGPGYVTPLVWGAKDPPPSIQPREPAPQRPRPSSRPRPGHRRRGADVRGRQPVDSGSKECRKPEASCALLF